MTSEKNPPKKRVLTLEMMIFKISITNQRKISIKQKMKSSCKNSVYKMISIIKSMKPQIMMILLILTMKKTLSYNFRVKKIVILKISIQIFNNTKNNLIRQKNKLKFQLNKTKKLQAQIKSLLNSKRPKSFKMKYLKIQRKLCGKQNISINRKIVMIKTLLKKTSIV